MIGRSVEPDRYEAAIYESATQIPFSTDPLEVASEIIELIHTPPEEMLREVAEEVQREFKNEQAEIDQSMDRELGKLTVEVQIKVAYRAPEIEKTYKPKESKISISQLPNGVVSMEEFKRKRRESGNYKF